MSVTTISQAPLIPRGEVLRKALHMLPGLVPFGLAFIPHPDVLDLQSKVVVVVIAVVLTAIFLSRHRTVRRDGEDNFRSTVISYPATIVATLLLFPAHAEFAGVVVTVLAFGDGCAYFGGTLFGHRKLPWNSHKSWAGTIAFVLCSAPIATLAYWIESNHENLPWAMAAICGTSAAVAGAIAESLPVRVTDNLRVGVAAAVTVAAVHFALVPLFL